MNQHSDKQYSYTKGLRFSLKHCRGSLPEPDTATKADLTKLCEAGRHLAEALERFIYLPKSENSETLARDRQGEYKPSRDVRINKTWLKQFFKADFYDQHQTRRQRTHELHQFRYALQGIARWRAEWRDNLDKLEQADKSALHEQTRRSDIASLLLQLGRRDQFPLIREFAAHARHKNKANRLPDCAKAVEAQLQAALTEYAPSQGAGVVVAAASLNYYTVNKKPKEYYDDKIGKVKKCRDELADSYEKMKKNKALQKSRLLELMLGERLNLQQIQDDKALSLFHRDEDRDCLEEVYRLTREISRLTKELNEHQSRHGAGTDHYRSLKGKLQSAKKERGFYFIKKTLGKHHNNYLRDWWSYCENYKKKAMDFGKLKAQLRGLEKEQQESQQFRYWAVFLRRKERLSLCCIPLHKCREAWKFLEKMANAGVVQADSEVKLYRFHSITQRALHKLCFAEASSFAEGLPRDLQHLLAAVNKASNDPAKKKPGQKTKAQLELEFFQTLLKDSRATDSLELSRFDFSDALEAKTLDDFQVAFDKAGYNVETIALDTHRAKTFVDRFKVLEFELTSYDLERRNENTHQTPESNARHHTELWRAFWEAVKQGEAGDAHLNHNKEGKIRLNPELKIRLRKADPDLSEYLRKKRFDLEKTTHRRLQDRYNLHLTMELNAGRLHSDLAFAKADEIDARIDRFNETFNKQNWDQSWKYGIDRGNIELATLCLARFDKNDTYHHGDKTLLKPSFPEGEKDIKVYTLKREKYNCRAISELETRPRQERREKQVIVNISYFIDTIEDSEWFEQHTCTCIDLTTAKVISGKLISNGDVLTFLKLKYEAAKRVLFDLVAQGKITEENKRLEWGSEAPENPASIQLRYGRLNSDPGTDEKAEERTVYFFEGVQGRNFEGLELGNGRTYTRETIRTALQHYLDALLVEQAKPTGAANKHVPPIEKINHLRDALVANMVGVIMHLQWRYPGIVMLEDLDMDLIQEHFQALNIDISRRLEFALYRKFQSLGKVPPHLKDLIQRRERIHANLKQEIDEAADKEYQKWLHKPKNKNASTSDKEKQKTEYWNQVNSRIRKEKNFSSQIGAIVFVDEYKTSKNCPYCGKSMSWGPEIEKRLKFEHHRFICGKAKSCGFDTGHFKEIQHAEPPLAQPTQGGTTPDLEVFREIDDPDKVAAYNVAGRIQDWTKIARFSNAGEAHGKGQRRG